MSDSNNNSTTDRILPPDLPLEEFLGQAIGRASVCWERPEGAGVFDDTTAAQLLKETIARVRRGTADARAKLERIRELCDEFDGGDAPFEHHHKWAAVRDVLDGSADGAVPDLEVRP